MSHHHAVGWIDHSEAHVMHVDPDNVEKSIVHPAAPHDGQVLAYARKYFKARSAFVRLWKAAKTALDIDQAGRLSYRGDTARILDTVN